MSETTTIEPEFLTAREAAEMLRLRPWSIYQKARSGELVAYCIGSSRSMRFRKADVIALMRKREPHFASVA